LIVNHPGFESARSLLKQIEDLELKKIFGPTRRVRKPPKIERAELIIDSLERDLGISTQNQTTEEDIAETDMIRAERWVASLKFAADSSHELTPQERFDLGIAFFEMDCHADALRELGRAEKKIRIEESFLGSLGVAIVALSVECMIKLGSVFEAKAYLEPVLVEADLKHEDKLALYYSMGLVEEELGHIASAVGWYQKVARTDADHRDVRRRIRYLQQVQQKS
jgi:tetratricopeptide (TPR) repeat protein